MCARASRWARSLASVERMTSLWLDELRPTIETDGFLPDSPVDELIVGAGLTGLVTALLFARAGRRVAVVEARSVGAVATGRSTAKLSLLQGTQLQQIRRHSYPALVRAYVDGNRAAQEWLLAYAQSRSVPVQRRDAYSYAGSPGGFPAVEREYRVARAAGLDARLSWDSELPFPSYGAVLLRDQAQLNPMRVLAALVADIRALGGLVIEDARVTAVDATNPVSVETSRGQLLAGRVYLTTGTPILDRGLYFAKLEARRSYGTAFEIAGPLPQGMYLSVEAPARSLRTAPGEGGQGSPERLLVGGNGHGAGRHPSPQSRLDELTRWTEAYFPGAVRTHAWSAQDYTTPHRVPFVGWLPRGRGRIYLATGYDKWGMTNAVTAALTLSTDVLGGSPAWAQALHHRATTPIAIGAGIGSNAAVAWWAAKGWAGALLGGGPPPERLEEGHGAVGHRGMRPVAVSTVDGATCALSGVCTHLGGVVTWNDAERSWDCPLHGSRFSATGEILEGPAKRPLARAEPGSARERALAPDRANNRTGPTTGQGEQPDRVNNRES
jgi:glycine/D-amino acid oxidase-like deaminating enzyme/nitrite reductase/ring-hydroxylating ferredoxin subunit